MGGRIGRLTSMWADIAGLRVHARVSVEPVPPGSPAVVLVHGLGVASSYFVPTAERLAPYYRVYALDLPGFGDSAGPPCALAIAELADALLSWMNEAGLERAVLLGNSLGCQVITDLAVRHPERIVRVVLVGPTVDPRARTVVRQVWRFLRNLPFERPSQVPGSTRDYLKAGPGRVARTLLYSLDYRTESKLPQVRVPTLIVCGGRDPIAPARWGEEAARLLPMGRLVVIPGAAHAVNYNSPLELTRVVRAFLDDDEYERETGEGTAGRDARLPHDVAPPTSACHRR